MTGCSLRRGPRNQWWIPVTVVEQLCRDADLLDAVRRRSEGGPNGTPAGDEILTALEQLLGEVRTNRALLQQLIAARGRGEAP